MFEVFTFTIIPRASFKCYFKFGYISESVSVYQNCISYLFQQQSLCPCKTCVIQPLHFKMLCSLNMSTVSDYIMLYNINLISWTNDEAASYFGIGRTYNHCHKVLMSDNRVPTNQCVNCPSFILIIQLCSSNNKAFWFVVSFPECCATHLRKISLSEDWALNCHWVGSLIFFSFNIYSSPGNVDIYEYVIGP